MEDYKNYSPNNRIKKQNIILKNIFFSFKNYLSIRILATWTLPQVVASCKGVEYLGKSIWFTSSPRFNRSKTSSRLPAIAASLRFFDILICFLTILNDKQCSSDLSVWYFETDPTLTHTFATDTRGGALLLWRRWPDTLGRAFHILHFLVVPPSSLLPTTF